MNHWDMDTVNLIHEERIKQAEQYNRAQSVIDANREENPRYNPTLAWVGRRIMSAGQKLIELSGSVEDRKSVNTPDLN
jgi:hypothetical protein